MKYNTAPLPYSLISLIMVDSGKKPADIPFGRFERYRDAVIMMLNPGADIWADGSEYRITLVWSL